MSIFSCSFLASPFSPDGVRLALELHEDDVPYFDNLRIVLINKLTTRRFRLFFGTARVYVYLRARATRACFAHFPEVVVLVSVDNVVCWQVFEPVLCSFVVAGNTFRGAAFEYGNIQIGRVQLQNINQILPRIVDGVFLEVVAKAPVAEHFEHCMVVGVVSDFFQVVVLATYTQAFLRVGTASWLWFFRAKNYIFPLVHTSVGEHQRRVVLYNHRCRRYNDVSFRLEKLLERVADFICCHFFHIL